MITILFRLLKLLGLFFIYGIIVIGWGIGIMLPNVFDNVMNYLARQYGYFFDSDKK